MRYNTDREHLENRVLQILNEADMPVSADFVAHQLGLSWNTAKSFLLELALEGRLRARKTTKSWIFESVDAGS